MLSARSLPSGQHQFAMIRNLHGDRHEIYVRIPDELFAIGITGLRTERFDGSICLRLAAAGNSRQLKSIQFLNCGNV